MRFTLRKKGKIVDAFDREYYDLLVSSLKAYFDKGDVQEHVFEGYNYPFLLVPSTQPKTDTEFQFAVVGKTFDVYNLSYFSAIG